MGRARKEGEKGHGRVPPARNDRSLNVANSAQAPARAPSLRCLAAAVPVPSFLPSFLPVCSLAEKGRSHARSANVAHSALCLTFGVGRPDGPTDPCVEHVTIKSVYERRGSPNGELRLNLLSKHSVACNEYPFSVPPWPLRPTL